MNACFLVSLWHCPPLRSQQWGIHHFALLSFYVSTAICSSYQQSELRRFIITHWVDSQYFFQSVPRNSKIRHLQMSTSTDVEELWLLLWSKLCYSQTTNFQKREVHIKTLSLQWFLWFHSISVWTKHWTFPSSYFHGAMKSFSLVS